MLLLKKKKFLPFSPVTKTDGSQICRPANCNQICMCRHRFECNIYIYIYTRPNQNGEK